MGKKKPKHGGARKGAGRKPKPDSEKTETVCLSLPKPLVAKLRAKAEGSTMSAVAFDALEQYLR